jgi:hypothetical protein
MNLTIDTDFKTAVNSFLAPLRKEGSPFSAVSVFTLVNGRSSTCDLAALQDDFADEPPDLTLMSVLDFMIRIFNC